MRSQFNVANGPFDYLGEFITRVARHWITLVGVILDVATLVALLIGTGDVGPVAATIVVAILVVVIFISAFSVFQEERRKSAVPHVELVLRPPTVGRTMAVHYDDGRIQIISRVGVRFVNYAGAAALDGAVMTWETVRRFRPTRVLLELRLVGVDGADVREVSIPLPAASATQRNLVFEGLFVPAVERQTATPDSRLVLRPRILGAPPARVVVAEWRRQKWVRPTGAVQVMPDWLAPELRVDDVVPLQS